jgi:hypothetical protein
MAAEGRDAEVMREPRMSCGQNGRRLAVAVLIAAGTMLGASGVAPGAEETSPAKSVAAFYDWYIAHHGQVSKKLPQVRRFFDDDLYGSLEDTYFKGDEYMGDILVYPCGPPPWTCKQVRYDPFTNDSSPAASYTIGVTHIKGGEATVQVTLRLSRSSRVESHISAILHSKSGRFVISNLLFESRGYYYTYRPIVDLNTFLGAYNC